MHVSCVTSIFECYATSSWSKKSKALVSTDRITTALEIARLARSLGNFDTNVLGMVGEVIAQDVLGMTKAPPQSKGIDGHIQVGTAQRSVQVKALSARRVAGKRPVGSSGFRVAWGDHPERLVVVIVFTKIGKYQIIFNNDASSVGKSVTVKGVRRREVCVSDLYKNREHELKELISLCKEDA